MKGTLVRLLPGAMLLLFVCGFVTQPALAQTSNSLGPNQFLNLHLPIFTSADPQQFLVLLGRVINFALLLAGIVAFFYVLYGGFMYLTSGGDQTGAQKGRTMIANALIGIVIIFVSYALINFFIRILDQGGTTGQFLSYVQQLRLPLS